MMRNIPEIFEKAFAHCFGVIAGEIGTGYGRWSQPRSEHDMTQDKFLGSRRAHMVAAV